MPRTTAGRALAAQLVRSGTSIGANYRAACRGRSRAEFETKIGTVAAEADESLYWIELISEGGLLLGSQLLFPKQEADELNRNFPPRPRTPSRNATIKTKHQR